MTGLEAAAVLLRETPPAGLAAAGVLALIGAVSAGTAVVLAARAAARRLRLVLGSLDERRDT